MEKALVIVVLAPEGGWGIADPRKMRTVNDTLVKIPTGIANQVLVPEVFDALDVEMVRDRECAGVIALVEDKAAVVSVQETELDKVWGAE